MSEIKSICVVCFANYCRSPVASELLKHKYSERGLEIISAGLALSLQEVWTKDL